MCKYFGKKFSAIPYFLFILVFHSPENLTFLSVKWLHRGQVLHVLVPLSTKVVHNFHIATKHHVFNLRYVRPYVAHCFGHECYIVQK